MNTKLTFALAVVASAFCGSARAANYSIALTGIVYQADGSAPSAVGDTISAQLVLVGDPGTISSFIIDGVSAPAGFNSTADLVPALTDAIYQAQVSPVVQGGSLNTTLALDLSALTVFPSTDDASTLFTDISQIPANLDYTVTDPVLSGFPSTFDYYVGDSNGTVIAAEYADLSGISVTVPEPASLALLAVPAAGLGALRRRRG